MSRLPIRVPAGRETCGWCFRPATCRVELRPLWRAVIGRTQLVPACAHCAAKRLTARR